MVTLGFAVLLLGSCEVIRLDANRVSMASLHDGGGDVSDVSTAGDVVAVFAEYPGGAWGALGPAVFHGADAVYVDIFGFVVWFALGSPDGCALFAGDSGAFGGGVFMVGICFARMGLARGLVFVFQSCNALISAPMIALITKVKLANLLNPAKHFPLYSIGGTLGWLCGSVWVSVLALDHSAEVGQIACMVRIGMSLLCFLALPATPPTDRESRGWRAALGLNAFGLLRDRDLRRFLYCNCFAGDSGGGAFHDYADLAD